MVLAVACTLNQVGGGAWRQSFELYDVAHSDTWWKTWLQIDDDATVTGMQPICGLTNVAAADTNTQTDTHTLCVSDAAVVLSVHTLGAATSCLL